MKKNDYNDNFGNFFLNVKILSIFDIQMSISLRVRFLSCDSDAMHHVTTLLCLLQTNSDHCPLTSDHCNTVHWRHAVRTDHSAMCHPVFNQRSRVKMQADRESQRRPVERNNRRGRAILPGSVSASGGSAGRREDQRVRTV